MSPFRKRSELRSPSDPVFIDLGSVPLPEGDERVRVYTVEAITERDLAHIEGLGSSGRLVVVDLSFYLDDVSKAETIMWNVARMTEGTVRKVGSDTWVVVPGDIVVEPLRRS